VTPSVLAAGGGQLDLNGMFLSNSVNRVPIGSFAQFPNAAAVGGYFGLTSVEYQQALYYFAGFDNSPNKPGNLLFAQYNTAPVSAFLRGANLGATTLAQIQALNGTLSFTINGTVKSGTVNLSTATSFASAAALIAETLEIDGAQTAQVTASQGSTFTGTGSGTNLTVAAIVGVLHPGDTVTGSGIPGGTTIVSQSSGTIGGNGVYVTSQATTVAGATTGTSTFLEVTAVVSGAIGFPQVYSGTGVTDDSYVTAFGSGGGGIGNYITNTAQQFASTTVTVFLPGVIYDSVTNAFVVTSGTTGIASTITYGSGALAAPLFLTQATGAVISQGAIAATPAAFMTALANITQNWASFTTMFDPDGGSGNTQKLLFAGWTSTQNNRYLYAAWDQDASPTTNVPATTSLGYLCKTTPYAGVAPIFAGVAPGGAATGPNLASFLCGAIASIDYELPNGRTDLAFRAQAGQTPSVFDPTTAANLIANGYNYYGAFGTANANFTFLYPGSVAGTFLWIDSYVNQIWMNNFFQSSLMSLLTATPSIAFNPAGDATIAAGLSTPINAAASFGAFRPGVTLSASQVAAVNAATGVNAAAALQNRGWYLQVVPSSPAVRQARGPKQCVFYYMDGQSVQSINLNSVELQ
jgi:hypothetical protein